MIDAKYISDALGGKQAGRGFLVCCPAHDDKKPSLSINDGDNGKPVVNCLAGCQQENVLRELKNQGLWPSQDHELSQHGYQPQRKMANLRKSAREKERIEKQTKAAIKAIKILGAATGDPTQHSYTIKKGVNLCPLIKRGPWPQRGWEDALLIPLYDSKRKITTISAIHADGTKHLLADGIMKGSFCPVGTIKGAAKVLIGEGLATVAAVCDSTGLPGVVAINSGNLKPVAEAIRFLLPAAEIIIIADDDQKAGGSNPGKSAAIAAAKAVGGKMAIPELGKKADAWDLWKEQGPEAVRKMINSTSTKAEHEKLSKADIEWPLPLPLVVHGPAAPYPLDALPGVIGSAVREVVEFVQCPIALGACSALSVVSTVIQGLVDVRRAEKLEGPTSLFLLALADSGERKSTVDSFFSKPLQQWESEQAELARPSLLAYEAENESWRAKKSGLLAAIKDCTKKGNPTNELESMIAGLESAKPEQPKVPRLLFGDATPEALASRLAFGWPVGGVLSSEAGIVFGGHAMGKDSAMRNMAMLNSLWGAEPLTIDRKTSPSYTVRGARLTMGLAVQPETVRAFLDSSKGLARGIGWLARFLIAWPESTQGRRMFKAPPENWPQLAKFHRRLGALLDYPLPCNDHGNLEPKTLDLSPEAKEVWIAFHDDVEAELQPGRDMAESKDVASKAADNAVRLAALFHLFEEATCNDIGPEHMRMAAVVAGWHLYEARRFMGEVAVPVELSNAKRLDEWLLNYCQQNKVSEVSTTTILQNGPNNTRNKSSLEHALKEMIESQRVQLIKDGRRKLVKINPALLGDSHGIA